MTASDNNTLIFVEVKYRKSANFGTAQEMVSKSKQRKIINTADIFLEQKPQYQNYECRFDVIAINNNDIEWIESAFEASL
ncbi:YraN family protein [Francisellaceae bacterium CB52]